MIKPFNNQVLLKMREDLEDNFGGVLRVNKLTGLIEPRPVYGEVIAVGKGDQVHPDIPDLAPGDLIVWDLSKIGPPLMYHGQAYSLVSFNALLAKLTNPKTDQEDYQALLDIVLTESAPLAMARAVSQLVVMPDTVQRDGLGERAKDNVVSTVYERVVSAGRGITFNGRTRCARCQCDLQRTETPECVKGDLVIFNPAHSIDWRRRGRQLRFTPFSELRGVADE